MSIEKLLVEEQDEGKRVDAYLSSQLQNESRSYIQKLIEKGNVYINNEQLIIKK